MTDSLEKTEHYAVFKLAAHKIHQSEGRHLQKWVAEVLEDTNLNYALIDLDGVREIDEDALSLLAEIHAFCETKTGLSIAFHGPETWIERFANAGVTLVPTKHEAIEYVFMDQLEKQFLSDEE